MRPLTDEETRTLFTKLAHYIGSNVVHLVQRRDDDGDDDVAAPQAKRNRGKGGRRGGNSDDEDDDDDDDGRNKSGSSSSASGYVFRLHKDRVYYVSERAMRLASSISRPNLCSLGTCFGKFSKTGKFRLHVTALDYLVEYAKYKVWIKPNGELPFLYGNHVVKAHLGRITDDTPEHAGVVVLSMSGVGLGFGVTARSTVDTRKLDPTSIIVFHQADVGEYLRDEDTLF